MTDDGPLEYIRKSSQLSTMKTENISGAAFDDRNDPHRAPGALHQPKEAEKPVRWHLLDV
jgi:hypothetical protein